MKKREILSILLSFVFFLSCVAGFAGPHQVVYIVDNSESMNTFKNRIIDIFSTTLDSKYIENGTSVSILDFDTQIKLKQSFIFNQEDSFNAVDSYFETFDPHTSSTDILTGLDQVGSFLKDSFNEEVLVLFITDKINDPLPDSPYYNSRNSFDQIYNQKVADISSELISFKTLIIPNSIDYNSLFLNNDASEDSNGNEVLNFPQDSSENDESLFLNEILDIETSDTTSIDSSLESAETSSASSVNEEKTEPVNSFEEEIVNSIDNVINENSSTNNSNTMDSSADNTLDNGPLESNKVEEESAITDTINTLDQSTDNNSIIPVKSKLSFNPTYLLYILLLLLLVGLFIFLVSKKRNKSTSFKRVKPDKDKNIALKKQEKEKKVLKSKQVENSSKENKKTKTTLLENIKNDKTKSINNYFNQTNHNEPEMVLKLKDSKQNNNDIQDTNHNNMNLKGFNSEYSSLKDPNQKSINLKDPNPKSASLKNYISEDSSSKDSTKKNTILKDFDPKSTSLKDSSPKKTNSKDSNHQKKEIFNRNAAINSVKKSEHESTKEKDKDLFVIPKPSRKSQYIERESSEDKESLSSTFLRLRYFTEEGIEQNGWIGSRNIHDLSDGKINSIGGNGSSFLIFMKKYPFKIAEVYYKDSHFYFNPIKTEFFPFQKHLLKDCPNKKILIESNDGHRGYIEMQRYIPTLKRINRILKQITLPGSDPLRDQEE